MKTCIVYDSVFGNTRQVAELIAENLGKKEIVEIKNVNNATIADIQEADRIVIGSPTRAFSPTPSMRNFLKNLPRNALMGKQVDIFDTRINIESTDVKFLRVLVRIFGYATDTMERIVRKKGASIVRCDWYYVADTEGPLVDTEMKRAAMWALS